LWHGHRRLGLLLSNPLLLFGFPLDVGPFDKILFIFRRPALGRSVECRFCRILLATGMEGALENKLTSIYAFAYSIFGG
jgi:hypothetical protein